MVREMTGAKKESNLDRFDYYETNRKAIVADLETLTRKQVLMKWGIPGSSLCTLLRRWEVNRPHQGKGKPPVQNSALLGRDALPIAWLEGYYQAIQDIRRLNGR